MSDSCKETCEERGLTRRAFLGLCAGTAGSLLAADFLLTGLAGALEPNPPDSKPVLIWLESMTCTGDFLSFMNSLNPTVREVFLRTVELRYSNTMMAAEGEKALDALKEAARAERDKYILVIEGTVPTRDNGLYGLIGIDPDGSPVTELEAVRELADGARYVVAAGTCASFGGPYSANPNPSHSVPVSDVVGKKVINVPGCPVHPDWLAGTLTHILLYGEPELDSYNRPVLFFGSTIHDNCPRRQYYDNNIFASKPGESGCAYLIGCKGPVTYADCPTRQWIGLHTNWPVEANTPCIGCVNPGFPESSFPFFEHLQDLKLPGIAAKTRAVGGAVAAATAGVIGAHMVANLATGRLKKNWKHETGVDSDEEDHISGNKD